MYFLVLAAASLDWAEKVEADFFQKRADVTQKKPLNNSGEQAYRLLQGNPDIAKLIIAALQKQA